MTTQRLTRHAAIGICAIMSACIDGPKSDTNVDTAEPVIPECGNFSIPGYEDRITIDWSSEEMSLSLGGAYFEIMFGMTGPLVPMGELYTNEGCILDEPPWGVTPGDSGCREVPVSGFLNLEHSADPTDYDPVTQTVFGPSVEAELTFVLIDNSYASCFVFGFDTCIYEAMDCHQIRGYAGD